MPSWRLARSLIQLRTQLDALSPDRSKVSDGSIGDASHAARASASDHNPNAAGVVTAIDVTNDPPRLDGHALSRELTQDSRAKYVIFAGEIWKARTGKWEKYRGPNRHDHHVHVSVKAEMADDVSTWALVLSETEAEPPSVSPMPVLRLTHPPMKGEAVKLLQQELNRHGFPVVEDGIFGYGTESALKKFQLSKGLTADGICGMRSWAALK